MSHVMTLSRSAALAALLAAFAVLAWPAPPSSAHPAGFYPFWYPIGIDDVPVRFDDDFPAGRARYRITDGAKEWNRLGRRMYFRVNRYPSINSDADNRHFCPTPEAGGRRVGMIHWTSIDGVGDKAAFTTRCLKKGTTKALTGFRIYFDRAEPWYTRTGDSRVKNRLTGVKQDFPDFWSTATHELGHATGWSGHWRDRETFCRAALRTNPAWRYRTMCPIYGWGLERGRTLAPGDKHVFRSQYAAR